MDTELIGTMTILLAVISGLVIPGLWIRRNGRFSRKLSLKVSKACVRASDAGTFDFQIDLDIDTRGENVCFEEMAISHPVWQMRPDTDISEYPLTRFVNHPGYCILDEEEESFAEKISQLPGQSLDIAGMKLSSGKYRCVSMIERIVLVQTGDGSDRNWPTEGWTLRVRTAAGKMAIPFGFSVHGSNCLPVFCRNYVVPPVPFACG